MSSISASEARRTLPEQLDRAERGERVSITRHGRVVAVLVSPDVIANRPQAVQQADLLAERLRTARATPLREPVIDPARAEELIAALDDQRSGR